MIPRIRSREHHDVLSPWNQEAKGLAAPKDLADLQEISKWLYEMSNCGLGQTAGSPLKDIIAHFKDEVEAHIINKECPAGVCPMSGTLPTKK